MSELIVVLMILVILIGASRLPALGDALGRTVRSFKRGIASDDRIAVRTEEGGGERDTAKPTAGKPSAVEAEDAELVDRKG
jgi:sec-independent protein translocase protein TatA